MKHYTIAYDYIYDNYYEIFEYAKKWDQLIKNALYDKSLFKNNNNNNYIFRCKNERDLEWLSNVENLSKIECDEDSLTKKRIFILEVIKIQITHLFIGLKTFFKVH